MIICYIDEWQDCKNQLLRRRCPWENSRWGRPQYLRDRSHPPTPPYHLCEDSGSAKSTRLVETVIKAKLKKWSERKVSPSLVCLMLDTQNSHIGVWQKRAGTICSHSDWIIKFDLHKNPDITRDHRQTSIIKRKIGDEQDRIALKMIEEHLNWQDICMILLFYPIFTRLET